MINGPLKSHANVADAGVMVKACMFAIQHREFYKKGDFEKLDRILALAEQRAEKIGAGGGEFSPEQGLGVRGFESKVDGSYQPIGIELPAGWKESEKLPLYVWLHGRGDKSTDLHFIAERLDRKGKISVDDAIVLHPFGRQCVGYKSAGETDVLEAIEFACSEYPVDESRIVLMGFSMGGAGVWHLAAHHTDRFVAASPGAGFAETAQYQKIAIEDYPPRYEQLLWKVYDVPGYVRNLFNIPVVAYSGENDKQIQAALVMEDAYESYGQRLTHLIGPGMGHKYHPSTLDEILRRMKKAAEAGQDASPKNLHLQTQHLRYATRKWIQVESLSRQYTNTVVDAVQTPGVAKAAWDVSTINVSRLVLTSNSTGGPAAGQAVRVDEQFFQMPGERLLLQRSGDTWTQANKFEGRFKRAGLCGPIDDAFLDPFMVVMPTGNSSHAAIDSWTQCELQNFQDRWAALFRGNARTKLDTEVTEEDYEKYHLVCWGTPESNLVIKRAFDAGRTQSWPLSWDQQGLQVGESKAVSASDHVLLGIYPNPLAPRKYLVLNSGVTFRQSHDRTNSLQNPHLPDWAIVSISEPPTGILPGKVVETGFFDEAWQFAPSSTW
ncbi:MAG: prolyl oligopeptidase family serine peptidase [Aureliella sp.]